MTVVFAVTFFTFTLLFPGDNAEPLYAGAAASIFGIFIGFSISGANDRISRVNELLKTENGYNLINYNMSKQFGKKVQDEVRELIDNYLIAQIDYKLEDFYRSGPEFNRLYSYFLALEPKTTKEEKAYDEIIEALNDQTLGRSQIETIVSERISRYEWASALFLLVLVVVTAYSMSDGTVLRAIFVSILATASLLLVLVLRDINNLKWDKYTWTWKPLRNLFRNLSLIPYYGDNEHEVKFEPGERFRLATYLDKYPDMSGKKVAIYGYEIEKKHKISKIDSVT